MSDRENIRISPGKLIALWRLLLLRKKYEELSVKTAIEITRDSGLFGGRVPAEDGLKLGESCELLEIKFGLLHLTNYCQQNVVILCDEEEPNIVVIRAILFRIISYYNFHWLLFFNEDSQIFKVAIPQDWIDLLESADLLFFDDEGVLKWWREILEIHHDYNESKKKEIGDVGEKLTIEYEKRRLTDDQIENPHHHVKWAARFGSHFGYDVLSIRGILLKSIYEMRDQIQIEVKSSVLKDEATFRFKVSRNEWNTALENIEAYYFFCWTGINLEHENASGGPFIVPAKTLENYLPVDRSTICEWTECRFIVDLSALSL
jgi:hypothetical protein